MGPCESNNNLTSRQCCKNVVFVALLSLFFFFSLSIWFHKFYIVFGCTNEREGKGDEFGYSKGKKEIEKRMHLFFVWFEKIIEKMFYFYYLLEFE